MEPLQPKSPQPSVGDQVIDVVVTLNEINDQHGTGPLLQRVLRGRRNLFAIRTRSDWGHQDFGDWDAVLPHEGSRVQSFRDTLRLLGGKRVGSVLCVPFLVDEIRTSIAIQAAFGSRLCCWIMDDQNIATEGIPDPVMREFLERCSLRLVTHPELARAYERKFAMRFHVLPAVVPHQLVSSMPTAPAVVHCQARRGALVGSFWDQSWFDRTCSTLAQCDCSLDWFGNNWSPWLSFSQRAMREATLQPQGIVPEDQLAANLREYPFVIVPAGSLDDNERNRGVARLSLPGRILFVMATSHTPCIILGSEETCAARFVRHFNIGTVVPYSAKHLSEVITQLLQPDVQQRFRRNATKVAGGFSDKDVVDWLRQSIYSGAPVSDRYDAVFRDYETASLFKNIDGRLRLHA